MDNVINFAEYKKKIKVVLPITVEEQREQIENKDKK